MITERQKELTIYLNTAAKAYYSGEDEILTNHAYDILEQELISLEDESGVVLPGSVTHKVGYEVVSGLKKVKHEVPALSLRKSKDPSDVWKFGKGMSLVGSWKEDGLTVFLTYDNGILTRALTRSDGYIGEDVTHIAKHFADIPLSIPYKKHLLIRGEAVIRYDDFNELNARSSRDYRNPRNLASGQVRLLDSTKLDVPIYFRPFRVIGENIATKYMAQMIWLKELGFDPVETETIDSFESLKEYIDKYEKKAENYPFPVDGLVFTYSDTEYGDLQPNTAKYAGHSFAFKWADEEVETVVREIKWSVGKKYITPVAIFDPVELEGTTVSRASVHNVNTIKTLNLTPGSRIAVYKANMIIPQIARNIQPAGKVEIPSVCPICGAPTEIRKGKKDGTETLHCTGDNCLSKFLKQLSRMAGRDGLNMVGIAEDRLADMEAYGLLSSPIDLFHLKKEDLLQMDGYQEKLCSNLLQSIENSRKTTFRQFFYSLGLNGSGHEDAKLLEKELQKYPGKRKTDLLLDYAKAKEKLLEIKGIGEASASVITELVSDSKLNQLYLDLLKELDITDDIIEGITASSLCEGLTFVVTGAVHHFSSRKELGEYIEKNGGKLSGSVSKKTSFLVTNETTKTSKMLKATELGIPVLSEDDFIERFGVK